MGIEPTMPLLAQSIIGFEDRGRHQSGTRFRGRSYHRTKRSTAKSESPVSVHARPTATSLPFASRAKPWIALAAREREHLDAVGAEARVGGAGGGDADERCGFGEAVARRGEADQDYRP
jgi:hypothetical protein